MSRISKVKILLPLIFLAFFLFASPATAAPIHATCDYGTGQPECTEFPSQGAFDSWFDNLTDEAVSSYNKYCNETDGPCPSGTASPATDKTFGMKAVAETAGLTKSTVSKTIPGLIGNVVSVGMALVGVLFFILILYGGLMWMTAAGNTEQSTKAQTVLATAVVGLIIVLSAYAITRFIFNAAGTTGGGDKCSQQYPKSGVCVPQDQCVYPPKQKVSGLCPGTTDIVCCFEQALEQQQP